MTDPSATEADLALALELADRADAITTGRFRSADLAVTTKPDMTPVSEADTAVEQALRDALARARPGDAILGEELGAPESSASDRRWILDPIDGTKSYLRGQPVWATLIALEDHGELTVGVVSAPALGRRWWGAAGHGAHVREPGVAAPRPLQVSAVAELGDAQLCFGGLEDWRAGGRLERLLALAERVGRTRAPGDFWQYMLVAEGAAEIACDPSAAPWDLAAPLVVVREAGGRFTDLSGRPTAFGESGLATNGRLHELARRHLG